MFKAARYMCPVCIQRLKLTQQSVEVLRIFPFLDDLKAKLPASLADTEDVVINTEERKVKWWHDHKNQLPHCWASAVKKVLLVQPSSVAAERVFSILNSSFNDQQETP